MDGTALIEYSDKLVNTISFAQGDRIYEPSRKEIAAIAAILLRFNANHGVDIFTDEFVSDLIMTDKFAGTDEHNDLVEIISSMKFSACPSS